MGDREWGIVAIPHSPFPIPYPPSGSVIENFVFSQYSGVIDPTPRHDALRRDAFPRRAWERGDCPNLLRRYLYLN
ncbi:MAG: hypothetical protein U9N73_06925, partial [Candidatus Auribacterota bacterium]|nr:hypothetical protein [Candidatus Auribacterota bacterium]